MSINLEGFIRRKTTIKLGDKDWVFTELSLADFAQFRAKMVKERKVNLAERRKELIAEAKEIGEVETLKLLDHLNKPVTDEDMDAEMESVEGVGFLAYLSLRYHYPEVSQEDAISMISIDNIKDVTGAMIGSIVEDKKKPKTAKKVKGKAGPPS